MSSQAPKSKDIIFVAGILLFVIVITYSAFSTISIPLSQPDTRPKKQTHRPGPRPSKPANSGNNSNKELRAIIERKLTEQLGAEDAKIVFETIARERAQMRARARQRKLMRQKLVLRERMIFLQNMSDDKYQEFRIGKNKLAPTREGTIALMEERLQYLENQLNEKPKIPKIDMKVKKPKAEPSK